MVNTLGRCSAGFVARDDFTVWFVVDDHARQAVGKLQVNQTAVNLDAGQRRAPPILSGLRRLAIDCDAAVAAISSSISRREPMPLCASSLCNLSGFPGISRCRAL